MVKMRTHPVFSNFIGPPPSSLGCKCAHDFQDFFYARTTVSAGVKTRSIIHTPQDSDPRFFGRVHLLTARGCMNFQTGVSF